MKDMNDEGWNGVEGKVHCRECRWHLASHKRWRFVRGHDKPRLMGVAPSTFQVVSLDPLEIVSFGRLHKWSFLWVLVGLIDLFLHVSFEWIE